MRQRRRPFAYGRTTGRRLVVLSGNRARFAQRITRLAAQPCGRGVSFIGRSALTPPKSPNLSPGERNDESG